MSAGCLVGISSRLLDNSKKLGIAKKYLDWQQTWKVFELEQTFNWKVFELGKTLASIWTSNKLGKCLD